MRTNAETTPETSIDAVAGLLARRRKDQPGAQPRHARSTHIYGELLNGEEDLQPEAPQRSRLRWRPPALSSLLGTLIVLLIAAVTSFALVTHNSTDQPAEVIAAPEVSVSTPQVGVASEAPSPVTQVFVHVTGAVHQPGVYEVAATARVVDVVDLAGGTIPDANTSAVNLASIVQDGAQIHIPHMGESIVPLVSPGDAAAPAGPATNPSPELVNINTATSEELQTLPKIGPATADKIIAWRQANGGFRDVAELDQVSGIGPATLENLIPLVTVS